MCLGFEWPGQAYRLRHQLEHAQPAERLSLIQRSAQYGAERAKDAILFALEDADAGVRKAAALAAGHARLRDAAPILIDWLADQDESTRTVAASALGKIGEPRALAGLTRALGDSAPLVRKAATISLGQLGIADAVVPLLGRLDDTDISVRIDAIASLAQLRDARAVPPLQNAALDTSPDVRTAALRSLGRIGDARALPTLTRALEDPIEDVRVASAAALGLLADVGSVRALAQSLERADARTAQAIVMALGAIDDDTARQLLIAQLKVPSQRPAATQSLLRHAEQLGNSENAGIPDLVVDLAEALKAANASTQAAIADVLSQMATFTSVAGAAPAILAVLPTTQTEQTPALLKALAATRVDAALLPLLEAFSQGEDANLAPVLQALRTYFEGAPPDSRAADPLLSRLTTASRARRIEIVALLGMIRAERALPALTAFLSNPDNALRISAIDAIGAVGVASAGTHLLPLLDDEDAHVRVAAARALSKTADAAVAEQMLDTLASTRPAVRSALLIALGETLGRLSQKTPLPAAMQKKALAAFDALIAGEDDALADGAIDALVAWSPANAVEHLAKGLRSPSSRRRAVATTALGQLEDKKSRALLRYVLAHGSAREVAAAAIALGETGDERDLPVLAKVAKRHHWPVPAAATYALARLAQRGLLRPHAAGRMLCELGASRAPYVRANVAAALTALAAAPCDAAGPHPLTWLGPEHAIVVRNAAARWAHASMAAGRLDAATATAALRACAMDDADAGVRSVCQAKTRLSIPTSPTYIYAYGADSGAVLRNRLVALRSRDGAVMVGRTNANGQLHVKAAPTGPLQLEDPGLLPLEAPH